jgi:Endoribonuclease L-PSP
VLDVRRQAQQVMANLAEALAAAGATLTDVLRTTVCVASGDRGDLAAAWEVVRAALGEHDAPSTLLGVIALGYRDQLVEVEAVALLGGRAAQRTDLRGNASAFPRRQALIQAVTSCARPACHLTRRIRRSGR